MKRIALAAMAVVLAMVLAQGTSAKTRGMTTAEPDSVFAAANAAYEAGAYADAVEMYAHVAQLGTVNADLYYNLGNAYFKSGELGRSVLWYERSLQLDPRSKDARANLGMVRSLLRDQQLIPPQTGVRNTLLAWHRRLTTEESVAVACGFYGLFCVAALLLIFRRTRVVSGIYRVVSWISPARLFGLTMTQDMVLAMVTTAAIALVFAGSAYTKIDDARAAQRGVVVSEEVTVFSGPSDDSTIQFRIHEGTIVSLRDGRSGWVRVDLPGDLSGWVEERTVERI